MSGQQALPSWQVAAVSAVLGLAVAAGAVTAAGPWDSGQRTAERARAAAQDREGGERHGDGAGSGGADGARASAVLAALGMPARAAGDAPAPTSRGLADALDPLLRDPALGKLRTAAVVDAVTGRLVYGSRAGTPAVPASTVKIATAVAALDALGPDHRLETEVVTGPEDGEIVLVGGGDPTLTREAPGEEPGDPASLPQLADRTARALKERAAGDAGNDDGRNGDGGGGEDGSDGGNDTKDRAKDRAKGDAGKDRKGDGEDGDGEDGDGGDGGAKNGGKRAAAPKVELAYDTSRYSGPARHPIGPNENIAPVSALMTDEGRLDDSDRGPAPRAEDPAREAAEAFAGLLRDRGVDVTGKPRHAKAPRGADRLAAVASPPVSALV
ncbi:D-alanyl-D-alanine carboxypeptidase, partial [Streptomyces sp. NPDC048845]|uniref:D-alanyl-D-alanine carboxypeptidase n=1 Tax=Streptomyces sp. NPDC048845 TaxID=3155390 RepID=UPI00343DDDB4